MTDMSDASIRPVVLTLPVAAPKKESTTPDTLSTTTQKIVQLELRKGSNGDTFVKTMETTSVIKPVKEYERFFSGDVGWPDGSVQAYEDSPGGFFNDNNFYNNDLNDRNGLDDTELDENYPHSNSEIVVASGDNPQEEGGPSEYAYLYLATNQIYNPDEASNFTEILNQYYSKDETVRGPINQHIHFEHQKD